MKKLFRIVEQPLSLSLGLFIMRAIAGIGFMFHGWGKIQNPMGWMGPESPVPGIFQALGAISEFGGGAFLVLGLLTTLSSLGLFFTMLVAVFFHAVILGDPFVNLQGGGSYELASVYLSIMIVFMITGPGRFSIDQMILPRK